MDNKKDNGWGNLAKSSPDGSVKSKDAVKFSGTKSNFGADMSLDVYYFDSYDLDDDTCFLTKDPSHSPKKAHKTGSLFCYWVDFKDVIKIVEDE